MPIYQYRCPECKNEVEKILPMQDRDVETVCDCGGSMRRLMSVPSLVVMAMTGKDKILDTLNGERKGVRSKRSQDALYRGIDYQRPLEERVFTGF